MTTQVAETSRWDALLSRLDIQPRPYRALLSALIRMDLRSVHYARATGVSPDEALPPLFWVTGQLLLVSFLASGFLFARVDARAFALCGLAIAALCTFSALVVGFDEVALDPKDRGILGPRPITPRTYAAARLTNLGCYVGLISAALTLCPAISGAFLRGAGPGWLPCYVVASLAVCVSSAALALLCILGFARSGRRLGGAKAALAWMQIAIFLGVVYGGQLVINGGKTEVAEWAASPPVAVTYTPLDFLARAVAWSAWEGPSAQSLGALAAGLGVALLLTYLALLWLTRAYTELTAGSVQRAALPRPSQVGTLSGGVWGALLGRRRALGFWWLNTNFRRDPGLRLRTWPLLSLALAAAVLGVLSGQAPDPFLVRDSSGVIALLAGGLIAAALPQLALALRLGEDPGASWLLRSAPLKRPDAFMGGVRLGLLSWTAYPALLLVFGAFAWAWGSPLHAALVTIPAWLLVEATSHWSLARVLRGLPFEISAARGGALQPAALPSALATGVAGGVAAAQW
ncbi:MAG: hypothetical protein JKY65_12885, partial [Planctomycetes bacterium]|nr:hypothetical protein [Planctomycetota bacterium]